MEPADEDVDIGGNDPPIPCYPPLEIEKDAALKSSKCSSSSSSSSDSDSSSGVCFFIVLYFFLSFICMVPQKYVLGPFVYLAVFCSSLLPSVMWIRFKSFTCFVYFVASMLLNLF